jgi:acetyl esterase/lipase
MWGSVEALRDEDRELVVRMRRDGVQVEAFIADGKVHNFPLLVPVYGEEALQDWENAVDFIGETLA